MTQESFPQERNNPSTAPEVDASSINSPGDADGENLQQIMKIPISVQFVLGTSKFMVEELIKFSPEQVIPTGMKTDDQIEIVANGRIIARGELVVVDDDTKQLGLMISSVVDRLTN